MSNAVIILGGRVEFRFWKNQKTFSPFIQLYFFSIYWYTLNPSPCVSLAMPCDVRRCQTITYCWAREILLACIYGLFSQVLGPIILSVVTNFFQQRPSRLSRVHTHKSPYFRNLYPWSRLFCISFFFFVQVTMTRNPFPRPIPSSKDETGFHLK